MNLPTDTSGSNALWRGALAGPVKPWTLAWILIYGLAKEGIEGQFGQPPFRGWAELRLAVLIVGVWFSYWVQSRRVLSVYADRVEVQRHWAWFRRERLVLPFSEITRIEHTVNRLTVWAEDEDGVPRGRLRASLFLFGGGGDRFMEEVARLVGCDPSFPLAYEETSEHDNDLTRVAFRPMLFPSS